MGPSKDWYVIYTKPRSEKKVHQLLHERGFESYCPTQRIKKKWSDRTKWVEEPLFTSYVFVYISEEQKGSIRFVPGVVNFIYWLGKPAIVKPGDIDRIKNFLMDHIESPVQVEALTAGQEVVVERGVLMDLKGKVVRVHHKTVEVVIESLGCKLIATIDKTNISKIS